MRDGGSAAATADGAMSGSGRGREWRRRKMGIGEGREVSRSWGSRDELEEQGMMDAGR